jgi:hypothetical protein
MTLNQRKTERSLKTKRVLTLYLFIVIVLFSHCSINRFVVNSAADFIQDGLSVLYQEEDLILAEQYLASNLKTVEILLARQPDNIRLNLIAAQGFGAYAMGFVEDYSLSRAEALYQRGLNYALQSLPVELRFTNAITIPELRNVVNKCHKEEIPALFWIGYNWGSVILQHLDDPRQLLNLAKVEMLMQRVEELDEIYYFAGVHLFFGCYYAGRAPILGGQPELGRKHFEIAIDKNNKQLMLANYLMARYYAVQTQNESLFDELTQNVIQFDLQQAPEIRLLNAIAKRKAEFLLQQRNKYF